MSNNKNSESNKPKSGYRKDGQPYKAGNTRDDGSYAIGKNRPPKRTRFQEGDNRKRGQRNRGVKNADTEFERELKRRVTIKENGKERKVTKSQAVDLRLIDNATRKGDNKAIEMVDQRRRRIAASKDENARRYHTKGDREILEEYLAMRSEELKLDPNLFGDPEPVSEEESSPAGEEETGNGKR